MAAVCSTTAAQRKDTLVWSRFDLDPGERRRFELPTKTPEARLLIRFEVLSPKDAAGVRVIVGREQELGRPYQATSYRKEGSLRTKLAEPGSYVVAVENRRDPRRSRVEIEVTLTSGPDPENLPVGYASPRKRLLVVSASVIGFLVILLLSGRALWRATRGRRPPPPLPPLWA